MRTLGMSLSHLLGRRVSNRTFWRGLAICGCLLGRAAVGRELVHLRTGFAFEADSHRVEGDLITLTASTGSLEFSAYDVLSIERLPDPQSTRTNVGPVLSSRTAKSYLAEAAKHQGLPPEFLSSVALVESGLNPLAVSPKGAIGLMQLMPSTADLLGVSARDITGNTEGGARYLRRLLLQYHGNSVLALAAYNAGPGAVAKFGGVPPYAETQAYIGRVLKIYSQQTGTKADGGQRASSLRSERIH